MALCLSWALPVAIAGRVWIACRLSLRLRRGAVIVGPWHIAPIAGVVGRTITGRVGRVRIPASIRRVRIGSVTRGIGATRNCVRRPWHYMRGPVFGDVLYAGSAVRRTSILATIVIARVAGSVWPVIAMVGAVRIRIAATIVREVGAIVGVIRPVPTTTVVRPYIPVGRMRERAASPVRIGGIVRPIGSAITVVVGAVV